MGFRLRIFVLSDEKVVFGLKMMCVKFQAIWIMPSGSSRSLKIWAVGKVLRNENFQNGDRNVNWCLKDSSSKSRIGMQNFHSGPMTLNPSKQAKWAKKTVLGIFCHFLSFFPYLAHFERCRLIGSLRKLYIPILLFNEESFRHQFTFLSPF